MSYLQINEEKSNVAFTDFQGPSGFPGDPGPPGEPGPAVCVAWVMNSANPILYSLFLM